MSDGSFAQMEIIELCLTLVSKRELFGLISKIGPSIESANLLKLDI